MGDLIDLECASQKQAKHRVKVTDFTNEHLEQNYLAIAFEDANNMTDEAYASRTVTSPQTRAELNKPVTNPQDIPEWIRNRCVDEKEWEAKKDYLKAASYTGNSIKLKNHKKVATEELKKIENRFVKKYGR